MKTVAQKMSDLRYEHDAAERERNRVLELEMRRKFEEQDPRTRKEIEAALPNTIEDLLERIERQASKGSSSVSVDEINGYEFDLVEASLKEMGFAIYCWVSSSKRNVVVSWL